jgi:hypothetical protein
MRSAENRSRASRALRRVGTTNRPGRMEPPRFGPVSCPPDQVVEKTARA